MTAKQKHLEQLAAQLGYEFDYYEGDTIRMRRSADPIDRAFTIETKFRVDAGDAVRSNYLWGDYTQPRRYDFMSPDCVEEVRWSNTTQEQNDLAEAAEAVMAEAYELEEDSEEE